MGAKKVNVEQIEMEKRPQLAPLPLIPDNSPLRTHCYLCGQLKDHLEIEHVIPRVLFKGSDPGEYVKLWSCTECNRAKGLDDEFVVRHLQATSVTAVARAGFQNALRGFRRDGRGKGLGYDILSRMEQVEIQTDGGLLLGRAMAIKIEDQQERFDSFFTNIAKGLFVRTSLALHDWTDYEPTVMYEHALHSQRLFRDPMLGGIRGLTRHRGYWGETFAYFTDAFDSVSVSFMYFYSAYVAVVFLNPLEKTNH